MFLFVVRKKKMFLERSENRVSLISSVKKPIGGQTNVLSKILKKSDRVMMDV